MWLISMINCPLSVRGHGHHVTSLNFGINVYLLSFSSYSKLIINSCKFFFSPTFIWHCVGCETSAEISPWSYHLWHQNIRIPIGYRSCSVVCVMIMLSTVAVLSWSSGIARIPRHRHPRRLARHAYILARIHARMSRCRFRCRGMRPYSCRAQRVRAERFAMEGSVWYAA